MPATMEEALAALRDGDRRVRELARDLTAEELARRGALGGGDWSVVDLLGHLASWERRALDAIDAWRGGREFSVLIGVRGVDDYNEENIRRWRRWRPDRVLSESAAIHDRILSAIEALTHAKWGSTMAMSNGSRHRLSTVLGSTLGGPAGPFRHAEAHLLDLDTYVSEIREFGPRLSDR
jgi:hypothetical protein